MTDPYDLHRLDAGATVLHEEWMIIIDTPDGGVTQLLSALEEHLPLRQGPYDCCSFVQTSGYQRFRALEGSHAGAEGTIQKTARSTTGLNHDNPTPCRSVS